MPEKCQQCIMTKLFFFSLDKSDPIGSGNFSVVYRALVKSRDQQVAVKCPLTTTDAKEFKAMLSEIKLMIHIGTHENIVAFIGACTQSIQQSL
jgi:serine/threonine protein kinase